MPLLVGEEGTMYVPGKIVVVIGARDISLSEEGTLQCKKKVREFFPSPVKMSLPNSPWAGIMTS